MKGFPVRKKNHNGGSLRDDSRDRTNRSSAFASSLAEQARLPAIELLNSPLGSLELEGVNRS
jgi:hypothetical protein